MRIFGFDLKQRSSSRPTSPVDDRWYIPFSFSQPSSSGAMVTPESALTHPTVYACVKVITETLSAISLILYKRGNDDEKSRATKHPLYRILKSAPNPRTTSLEFRETMTGHYLLRGNAYAQIIRTYGGDVESLWILHPDRMQVLVDPENQLVYKYTKSDGTAILFKSEQILHLKGPSTDGVTGRSPIDCWRETCGVGMTMARYLGTFYGNNASPSGILTLPDGKSLTPKAKDRLREDWQKKHGGVQAAGNTVVLEDGVTWQQVGMSSADAQFVDTKKMNAIDIASIFRMPLHKIGILDRATYNNIEFQAIEFLTDTMLPHLKRWEAVIDRDLLRGEFPDRYFAEFLVDSILRGDLASRYNSYAIGRQWGWLSTNDIRRLENLNPIEGGEIYLQPLNMIEASKATDYLLASKSGAEKPPGNKDPIANPGNTTAKKAAETPSEKREITHEDEVKTEEKVVFSREKAENGLALLRRGSARVIEEILGRVLFKESSAAATARKRGKFEEFSESFYTEHREFTIEALRAATHSYLNQVSFVAVTSGAISPDDFIVSDRANEAISATVDKYFAEFKEAGDRVGECAKALSIFLVRKVEDLFLWDLIKE